METGIIKRLFSFALVIFALQLFAFDVLPGKEEVEEPVSSEYMALSSTVNIQHIIMQRTWYDTEKVGVIWGSGVLLEDGFILSCYHILDGCQKGLIRIYCFTKDGTEVRQGDEVAIIAYSQTTDLLLLQTNPPFNAPGAKIADNDPMLGDKIFFTGHTKFPVTRLRIYHYLINKMGIFVSPTYFGDSGGGVFDVNGRLIGIIQAVLTTNYPAPQVSYCGYAAPRRVLQTFLEKRPRDAA